MTIYESYKKKVEKRYNKDLVEVMKELYVTEDLGPSVSAKQLGIPRRVFIHFVHQYDLKKLKFEDCKKKIMMISRRRIIQ